MRHRTFRHLVDSGDGDRPGDAALEEEVERDAVLAVEFEHLLRKGLLLPWLASHPDVDWTCFVPALLRVAAIDVMAACPGTTPNDFAEMAREVANGAEADAKAIAKKVRDIGRG